jgi:hypothetical protein
MHRILFLADTGYPVRAGYRISGRISGQILELITIFLVKYQVYFLKTASTTIAFCKH